MWGSDLMKPKPKIGFVYDSEHGLSKVFDYNLDETGIINMKTDYEKKKLLIEKNSVGKITMMYTGELTKFIGTLMDKKIVFKNIAKFSRDLIEQDMWLGRPFTDETWEKEEREYLRAAEITESFIKIYSSLSPPKRDI